MEIHGSGHLRRTLKISFFCPSSVWQQGETSPDQPMQLQEQVKRPPVKKLAEEAKQY